MKKSCLTIAILIIIILAGLCVFLNIKMLQYKKIIDYHFAMPKEMFSISGPITEIQNNVISMETIVVNPYVLPSKWKREIVKVTVGEETKLTKMNMNTKISTEAELSDFRVGEEITATVDENIKAKTAFVANSIEVFLFPEIE